MYAVGEPNAMVCVTAFLYVDRKSFFLSCTVMVVGHWIMYAALRRIWFGIDIVGWHTILRSCTGGFLAAVVVSFGCILHDKLGHSSISWYHFFFIRCKLRGSILGIGTTRMEDGYLKHDIAWVSWWHTHNPPFIAHTKAIHKKMMQMLQLTISKSVPNLCELIGFSAVKPSTHKITRHVP